MCSLFEADQRTFSLSMSPRLRLLLIHLYLIKTNKPTMLLNRTKTSVHNRYSSKSVINMKKSRVLWFSNSRKKQTAVAQTSLTSHSSHTGISFCQLALSIALLTCQGGGFFPLSNGTSLSFPERGGWKGENWSTLRGNRFSSAGYKGRQHRAVTLSRWQMSWDGFLLLLLIAEEYNFWGASVSKSSWRKGMLCECIHWVNSTIHDFFPPKYCLHQKCFIENTEK